MNSEAARLSAILEVMIEVAYEAGRLVLPLFENGCASKTKADGSLVTLADTKGEALIRARLASAFPDVELLGEESHADGAKPDLSGAYFCVDPIDGTKQFASGDPQWVISIGYLENGRPVAGVIYAPALNGRLFAGLSDFGGFEQFTDGERKPLASAKSIPRPLKILRGGHDSSTSILPFLPPDIDYDMEKVSSALKFCLIAAGEADLWIRVGHVWDWDIAAGQAIVEAAGGRVTDGDGGPLVFGQRDRDYRHPPFIVRCAGLNNWASWFDA
jgi:3'(2'), 5'-bisphosphate nucleotidase